jgi:high-affinity nickel permease
VEEDLNILLNGRGLLARILRPLFRLVTRSWHMIPLGFLFGLGFDTATEIALFGVAATQLLAGGARLELSGGFWDGVGRVGHNFNGLGFITIGLLVAVWASSYLIYRFRKLDELEMRPQNSVSG